MSLLNTQITTILKDLFEVLLVLIVSNALQGFVIIGFSISFKVDSVV